MEYKDLVKDFAKRTLKNYHTYNGDYEVTNLINSSLGLFVFPEQKSFNKISDDWISGKLLNELKTNVESNYDEPINFKNICKHIRNGISHFHLEIKSDFQKEITRVIVRDRNCKTGEEFRIEVSIELLKGLFFEFSEAIINR